MSDFPDEVRVTKVLPHLGPGRPEPVPVIVLNATSGVIVSGGHGESGIVDLKDKAGNLRTLLSPQGLVFLKESPPGGMGLGEHAIHLNAETMIVAIRDANGNDSIRLDGSSGNGALSLKGSYSRIALRTPDRDIFAPPAGGWIRLEAEVHPDGTLAKSRISLWGKNPEQTELETYTETIIIDGKAGDIILKNADCAEEFDVAQREAIDPGTVVVIEDEVLHPSDRAYDKRVAGVISGAGGLKAGITLDRKASAKNRMPVALLGKTFCKVDADYAAIDAGDLLTTSPTRGHAMKAADSIRAFGAVLGKALRPIEKGKGLIPVLVALQ